MKIKLAHLESRLQALIEGSAARLFPGYHQQTDLASRLIEAMQENMRARSSAQPGREPSAPNLFTLLVHPSQARVLLENRSLIETLSQTIREAGTEAGLYFVSPPVIRIEAHDEVPPGEIRVLARNSRENLPQTTDLVLEEDQTVDAIPTNAFLIVDGTRIFPLELPVINIGRRSDNQLVIDDPRISRVHAQLRAVRGHFVIFDLNSTGGTFVNGKRIRQNTLIPGDVISLSNLPIVFGQDESGLGETQDYNPFSPNVSEPEPPHEPH
jgi:hypothetical protein